MHAQRMRLCLASLCWRVRRIVFSAARPAIVCVVMGNCCDSFSTLYKNVYAVLLIHGAMSVMVQTNPAERSGPIKKALPHVSGDSKDCGAALPRRGPAGLPRTLRSCRSCWGERRSFVRKPFHGLSDSIRNSCERGVQVFTGGPARPQ